MKNTQENVLSMFRTLFISVERDAAVLVTLIAFWANYLILRAKVELIEKVAQNQLTKIKGFAKAKAKARDKLIDLVMMASGMMYTYASDVGDDVLAELVKTSRTALKQMRDELMYDLSKVIIDKANILQPSLGAYGMTNAMLADMNTALEKYHEKIETPAEARNARKQYTSELDALIKDALTWVKEHMDKNVEVLRISHPDVLTRYKNSRMIFDYRGGSKKVETEEAELAVISGMVTDTDGMPVADAVVRIDGTTINTTTDADGEYLIDALPAGSYNLVVSLEGFKEAKENNFKVVAGDDVVKDFVIEAE